MVKPPQEKPVRRSLLRRADQAALGAMTLAALISMAGYWLAQGGLQGRLVDIDRAPPREARFQVNVNEANWPELAQLPEVGETLAKRIVESRAKQGPFLDHDELRRVQGIGPKTLERIRPYLLPMPDGEAIATR